MFTVSFISVFFSIHLCYRQAANSTHMQHNDWYFLYCSVTSSPHTDWNTFTLKMFSRLSQQVELVLLGQMNMGVCSWVQLDAVLHIHIVFKADAALLCKLITCLLLGVCKDLCTTWYDMELIIKLCVCVSILQGQKAGPNLWSVSVGLRGQRVLRGVGMCWTGSGERRHLSVSELH